MGLLKLLRALFRSAIGWLVGIGFSVSLMIAILQLSPAEWTKNLGAWVGFLRGINPNILWLTGVALLLVGFYQVYRKRPPERPEQTRTTGTARPAAQSHPVEIIRYDKDEMGKEIREMIEEEGTSVIRVFAYTAETLRDYLTYADRYRSLSVRILVRDWTAERTEEEAYNRELARRDASVRPWSKSQKIKGLAQEFSDQMRSRLPYSVQVRFFRGAPVLKGIIVSNPRSGRTVGFLGLYKWEEWPKEGGSRYKGDEGVVLRLCSDDERHRVFLERFVSQFDRIWLGGSKSFEDVG
jgi:hypothetical protein